MAKYLDSTQFARVWAKNKELLAGKADNATTLAGYNIGDAYTKTEIDSKLTSAMRYKGSVASESDLPASATVGDVWDVQTLGHNFAWNGSEWDDLGGTLDLSAYLTRTDAASTYVAKVSGKALSTNDYTTAEKNKLAGIESAAEVNVIETVKVNGTALTVTDKAVNVDLSSYATTSSVNTALAKKVDIVSGKGLSTNDYTTAEKTKLSGIESGAEVNVIESITVNGVAATVSGKKATVTVTIPEVEAMTEAEIDAIIEA